MCVECEDQPIAVLCQQCNDKFCEVCYRALHKKGSRKHHTFVKLISGELKFQKSSTSTSTSTLSLSTNDNLTHTVDENNNNKIQQENDNVIKKKTILLYLFHFIWFMITLLVGIFWNFQWSSTWRCFLFVWLWKDDDQTSNEITMTGIESIRSDNQLNAGGKHQTY
jgi:ATP-dependent Zn protease